MSGNSNVGAMSPAARISLLFPVVAGLPFLPPPATLAALALAALLVTVAPAPLRTRIVTGAWRLRWLIVAIVLLYAWGGDVPWLEAGARIAVLVCAVAAVQFALFGVPAHDLADGLERVLKPLSFLGLPTARFAHRLVATLDAVPAMQARIADSRAPATGTPLERLAARAAAVIESIEQDDRTAAPVGATLSASRIDR